MTALADHLDDYLRLRRALGFQLGRHGESLPGFVAYLEANGAATITVELAVAWARLPQGIKPITVDYRLSAVRGFARYLHALDPAHQIPPRGSVVGAAAAADAIHLHTGRDRRGVGRRAPAAATVAGRNPDGAARAGGGDRHAQRRGDGADPRRCRPGRGRDHGPARQVRPHAPRPPAPIGHHQAARLRRDTRPALPHAERRSVLSVRHRAGSASTRDRRGLPRHHRVDRVAHRHRPARVHDLRHAFAVHTLIDAHRNCADISALLPVLSTYLGHVEPANTYWYLSAVPELTQLAAARLESSEDGRP